MRYALHLPFVIAVLITGLGFTAHGAIDGRSAITVQYVNPQNFTDFSIHDRDIRYSASVFAQEITKDLEPVMNNRFPGDRLTLRFTNIELAGLVVRTTKPILLCFDYFLQDQSGRAIASGSERLVETPWFHDPQAVRSGPVPFESRMLQRWLRSLSVTRQS
jgi:hypothetical protein